MSKKKSDKKPLSVYADYESWLARDRWHYDVLPFLLMGLKHPKYPYGYLMGIECDGATYHSSKSARERDIIRQQILENLGWKIYRIWSTDWFSNPVQEFDKLRAFIETLLESNDLPAARQENTVIEYDFAPEPEEDQRDLFVEKAHVEEKPHDASNIVQLFDSVTYLMVKDIMHSRDWLGLYFLLFGYCQYLDPHKNKPFRPSLYAVR